MRKSLILKINISEIFLPHLVCYKLHPGSEGPSWLSVRFILLRIGMCLFCLYYMLRWRFHLNLKLKSKQDVVWIKCVLVIREPMKGFENNFKILAIHRSSVCKVFVANCVRNLDSNFKKSLVGSCLLSIWHFSRFFLVYYQQILIKR